jgi:hypothetical protein
MRLITLTCPNCGTIVSGNVLERRREVTCFGLDCRTKLRFDDLPRADRDHLLERPSEYRVGEEA